MAEKLRIIEALGEARLALPALTRQALSANDRAKYYFTLLQEAQYHADHPESPTPRLAMERSLVGVADDEEDISPATSSRGGETYRIPGIGRLCSHLEAALEQMLYPLKMAGTPDVADFSARLRTFKLQPWCDDPDHIARQGIARLTSGDRKGGDSAHLLVMDMHKALNALQARIASMHIEGASVYDIEPEDEPIIGAFMRGVNRTSALKFDHPGLGTTATRNGKRLVLQNDIGTTDAHVLVVHIERMRVIVTYTDVHLQRLLFFQGLFEGWPIRWEDTRSRTAADTEEGVYHLALGTLEAESQEQRDAYLSHLGSRLVFLIDWNRARKRLRPLLPKEDALQLLRWAAGNDVGHMGFLRAGAEQTIFDALRTATQSQVAYGARLDELLGPTAALEFMHSVFRSCTEGMLAGRSEDLIRDEIRTELAAHFHSAQQDMLDIASEHACLIFELAAAVRDALSGIGGTEGIARLPRTGERCKAWEHRADQLVNRAREIARRSNRTDFLRRLVEMADDIADELEESAFHLTLLESTGEVTHSPVFDPLCQLATLVLASAQEFIKALEANRDLRRGAPQEDMHDFLESIHRIVALERESDSAHREVKVAAIRHVPDCRHFYALTECARNLEAAADALMHAALSLRDQALAEVLEK